MLTWPAIAARWSCVVLLAALACAPEVLLAKKKPPLHPVNLTTASAAELREVPGIGPSTADKILQMRKSYGSFKSVDDLRAIKGIGPKKLDKMRKYLTVSKTPQGKKTPQTAQGAAPQVPAKSRTSKKPVTQAPPAQKTPPPPAASEDEEPQNKM
jgi:competence ComEA-like helix-hairpin-helix protein